VPKYFFKVLLHVNQNIYQLQNKKTVSKILKAFFYIDQLSCHCVFVYF